MKSKHLWLLSILIGLLSTTLLKGQENKMKVPNEAKQIATPNTIPNATFLQNIQDAFEVSVFHFEMDSTGKTVKGDSLDNLLGFKVKKQLDRLYTPEVRKVQAIFGTSESYSPILNEKDAEDWHPDLAFKFKAGGKSVLALVMAIPAPPNNIVKFYTTDNQPIESSMYPAREDLIGFAKEIFLWEYYQVKDYPPYQIKVIEKVVETEGENQGIETTNNANQEQAEKEPKTYRIKKKDKWKKVAKKYNLTVKELKALNKDVEFKKGNRLIVEKPT